MKILNVLIACEESQRMCVAFREFCHCAYSCDLQECSGGHKEWHIKGDCIPLLSGDCNFITEDGKKHEQHGKWDLIIAHPPLYLYEQGWCSMDVPHSGEDRPATFAACP